MSLAGLHTFVENLNKVMDSKKFKESNETEKMKLGYRLLNSKYGLGTFGGVKKLKEKK